MKSEPLNLDDPRLTDFALGELPASEVDEFTSLLAQSPTAQKELEATEDIMDLLKEGLRSEVSLMELTEKVEPDNVIAMPGFGWNSQTRKGLLRAAAVVAGILVVGAMVLPKQQANGPEVASNNSNQVEMASLDQGGVANVSGPALLLAEEMEDFDLLVEELGNRPVSVNDSYLGSQEGVVLASYNGNTADSYLKPGEEALVEVGEITGASVFATAEGKGRLKTYTRSGSWSGVGSLLSSHGKMQSGLAELVENLDGDLSSEETSALRDRLRDLLLQGEELGQRMEVQLR